MSSASPVPSTSELEGDDAIETAREIGLRQLSKNAFMRFRFADGFSHSRALAFQLILTLLPSLIAVVGLANVLNEQSFTDVLVTVFEDVAPGPAGQLVIQTLEEGTPAARESGEAALVLGLIAALVAGAGAMGQIERGANRIYGVERDRPTLRKYLLATALTLSAGLAVTAAFLLLVIGAPIGDALVDVTGWSEGLKTTWEILRWPVGAALVAGAVALVFKVSPRRPQPEMSWLALGSLLSVLCWFVFTGLLALYIGASKSFGETYGPLAGVIGLMLWAFATALALFVGLAFAAQLEAERAGISEPGSMAEDQSA